MIDPSKLQRGLTPVAGKDPERYLHSVETNVRSYGFALLRARAKTIGKAIDIALTAMEGGLCAITSSAVIGCERLPSDRGGGESAMVPFIEILLLPLGSEEAEEPLADGTLVAVGVQGSTAQGAADAFRAVCRDRAERIVLQGCGAYGVSRVVQIATFSSERGLVDIDGQEIRMPEKVLTGSARFGCTDGAREPFVQIGVKPIFVATEGAPVNFPAKPESVILVEPTTAVDVRPLITSLARDGQVFLRANAASLTTALALAYDAMQAKYAHFPDFAYVRKEPPPVPSGVAQADELVLYIRMQASSLQRPEPAKLRTDLPEIIQIGTQHMAEYLMALAHEVLVTPGVVVSSAACEPASSLKLIEQAVAIGIIEPPTSASLEWTPKDGFRVQFPASPRIVLR